MPSSRRVPTRGQPGGQGQAGADDPCRGAQAPALRSERGARLVFLSLIALLALSWWEAKSPCWRAAREMLATARGAEVSVEASAGRPFPCHLLFCSLVSCLRQGVVEPSGSTLVPAWQQEGALSLPRGLPAPPASEKPVSLVTVQTFPLLLWGIQTSPGTHFAPAS